MPKRAPVHRVLPDTVLYLKAGRIARSLDGVLTLPRGR